LHRKGKAMIEQHTSQLQQYGVISDRRDTWPPYIMWKYKRPKKRGAQTYTEPKLVGLETFRNRKDALAAKAEFDKPIH
jgi:hypothetical protein